MWDAAVAYDIDPVVMVAQSGNETGWGKFGGIIDETFHNTCGLKTRQGGADNDPNAHKRFASWEEGAEAHAQHLYAYMTIYLPLDKELVDPRWFVFGYNYKVRTLQDLAGKWATDPKYMQKLVAIYTSLVT